MRALNMNRGTKTSGAPSRIIRSTLATAVMLLCTGAVYAEEPTFRYVPASLEYTHNVSMSKGHLVTYDMPEITKEKVNDCPEQL